MYPRNHWSGGNKSLKRAKASRNMKRFQADVAKLHQLLQDYDVNALMRPSVEDLTPVLRRLDAIPAVRANIVCACFDDHSKSNRGLATDNTSYTRATLLEMVHEERKQSTEAFNEKFTACEKSYKVIEHNARTELADKKKWGIHRKSAKLVRKIC